MLYHTYDRFITGEIIMCFNIAIARKQQQIEDEIGGVFETYFEPKKHISAFTNPKIPVITEIDKKLIKQFNWGLIPHWVADIKKAEQIRKMTYNAKSETIHEKPSFKYAISDKRCLVITDGFYEWESTPTGKQCHYIILPSNEIMTIAGIWSEWTDSSNDNNYKTVSILTQPANSFMAKIHNIKKRQPVIIEGKNREEWLRKQSEITPIIHTAFGQDFKATKVESPLKRN